MADDVLLRSKSSEVVVLCEGLDKRTSSRTTLYSSGRVRSSSRDRMTMTIKSEPLVFNLDPKALGASVTGPIAEVLRERVSMISSPASEGTLRYRDRALKAFVQGKRWAVKRYSGGKIGSIPPARSNSLFNDSGRFARGIAVGATKDGFVVNVPANRLDPTTTDGDAGVIRIWQKLVALVPELASPEMLMNDLRVRRGIEQGVAGVITKAAATTKQLSDVQARLIAQRNKVLMNLLKDLIGMAA